MTDGMTVRLHRHLPDQAQVVGFSYGLGEEQASYLLSEARVEGLAVEAVEAAELSAVLNSGEFQARCGGSLRWLQGLDLLGELQLEVGVWVCGCVGLWWWWWWWWWWWSACVCLCVWWGSVCVCVLVLLLVVCMCVCVLVLLLVVCMCVSVWLSGVRAGSSCRWAAARGAALGGQELCSVLLRAARPARRLPAGLPAAAACGGVRSDGPKQRAGGQVGGLLLPQMPLHGPLPACPLRAALRLAPLPLRPAPLPLLAALCLVPLPPTPTYARPPSHPATRHPPPCSPRSRLPAGLTSLDLCGVPREEDDPFARDSWPDFVNRPGQQGGPSIAHLRQLQELSLRHFRCGARRPAAGRAHAASVRRGRAGQARRAGRRLLQALPHRSMEAAGECVCGGEVLPVAAPAPPTPSLGAAHHARGWARRLCACVPVLTCVCLCLCSCVCAHVVCV